MHVCGCGELPLWNLEKFSRKYQGKLGEFCCKERVGTLMLFKEECTGTPTDLELSYFYALALYMKLLQLNKTYSQNTMYTYENCGENSNVAKLGPTP